MAIVNRDLHPSQQCETIMKSYAATATGVTNIVALVETPSQAITASLKAFGLSGAPVYSLNIVRVVAAGVTTIGLGATVTAVDGATFAQGISITLGATWLLQAGDLITMNSGAANTAATNVHLTLILKSLQDVKGYFNQPVIS